MRSTLNSRSLSIYSGARFPSFFRSRPTYLNLLLLHNTLARSPLVGSSGIDRDRCLLPSSSPNDEGRSQEVAKQRIFTYIKQPPTDAENGFSVGECGGQREREGGSGIASDGGRGIGDQAREGGGKRGRERERESEAIISREEIDKDILTKQRSSRRTAAMTTTTATAAALMNTFSLNPMAAGRVKTPTA